VSSPDTAQYPILYRTTLTDEEKADYENVQEYIAEVYAHLTATKQLDLLLIFANVASMQSSMLSPDSSGAIRLKFLSVALRELIACLTHLHPDAPRPALLFEKPELYWSSINTGVDN
jgi:hypothetical protein